MQGFDSDATYCSQVENSPTQQSTHSGKSDRSIFRNVRRSQRLLQRKSKNKNSLNIIDIRHKLAPSPPYPLKMNLRRRSQSSTHFRTTTETDVCSQPVDLSKDAAPKVRQYCDEKIKAIKINESVDLIAELETQTLTQEIPLNQKHLLDKALHSPKHKNEEVAEIDLTRSASNNDSMKKRTKGRPRKKEVGVIDLTNEVIRLDRGCNGTKTKPQRKTKAKESLCDIEPKIPKTDKLGLSSPTISVFPLSSEDLRKFRDNIKPNIKKQSDIPELPESASIPPKRPESVTIPPKPTGNYFKTKIKVDCENTFPKKTKQPQNIREKLKKNKRRMPTSTLKKAKLKKEMITRYLNLADFVEDNENERRKRKGKPIYPMSPQCPDNCTCTDPIPIKPIPLLRSVANSVLPKVYPPHFIHQKPPIDTSQMNHIPYEQTHLREMAAYQRTNPNRHCHTSPRFGLDTVCSPVEYKAKIPQNNTPMFMMCPPESSLTPTKVQTPRVRPQPITPERSFVPNCLTPDQTQSPLNGETTTTSTTPSLPDSLKGVFESDDIREILNLDKIEYKLCDNHVKALAIVLNIRVENLREVLKNIVKLDQTVLKKIESAMKAIPKESNENTKLETGCFVRNLMSPARDANSKNANTKQRFLNGRNRV